MLGLEAAIATALVAMPAPAAANPPEEEAICLSDAVPWRGSAQDVANIHSVPVPASYRQRFFGDPCTRWQLVEQTLIDWHLAFGDEASTTAAIAFLEAGFSAHMPAPPAFQTTLARTWQAAEREVAAASRLPAAERDQRIGNGRAFRRLQELVEDHKNLVLLTRQYLRAAEFYDSSAMLARAQAWYAVAKPAFDLIYREVHERNEDEPGGVAGQLQLSLWYLEEMADIEMRIALLRARLSGASADVEAAAASVASHFDSRLQDIPGEANNYGGVVCGGGDRRGPPSLEQACEAEYYLAWRTIDIWENQAWLDLLRVTDGAEGTDSVDTGAFDQAVRFLEAARTARPTGPLYERSPEDDLIALYLARSALFARIAAQRRVHGGSPDQLDYVALEDLARAAVLAPPTRAPARFRQIATRYLALHDAMVARRDPAREQPAWGDNVPSARQAAAFRIMLAGLDRIVQGENPPRGH